MKYNTLLFDFDGTVVNSIEAIILSMTDAFNHFDLEPPTEKTIRSYIGIPLHKIPYVENQAIGTEELVKKYREIYEGSYGRSHIHVFDGMKELLLEQKEKGTKLGIVSSKMTAPIEMNIKDTDLEGIFDVIIGSDQVTQFKPFPQTVFLCAHQIGLEHADEALVIGDAHHDIEMGQRAGMHTCAVSWGAGTEEELRRHNPTYYVDQVKQLSDILAS